MLRETNEKTANKILKKLNLRFLEITPRIAIEASRFKYKNKKLKLSYADCIGYITAKKFNMKFLTGDNKFKNISNVEFVK